MATKPKVNVWAKKGLLQARVDNADYAAVLEKAAIYTKGNLSNFVREACLNYRPLKKVAK